MTPRSVRWALLPGLVVVLLAWSQVGAADRFVSKTGNDAANDCSALPCLTIGHALTQAASGDVVKVAAGFYREALVIDSSTTLTISGGWTRDFSLQTRTTVVSAGGVGTVFDISAGAGEVVNVTLDRLTVYRGGEAGILARSTDDGSLTIAVAGSTVRRAIDLFGGVGISAVASGTSALHLNVNGSVIKRNVGPGIRITSEDGSAVTATIDGCELVSNARHSLTAAVAIGVYANDASMLNASVTNSLFKRNAAGFHSESTGTASLSVNLASLTLRTNGIQTPYGGPSAITSSAREDSFINQTVTDVLITRQLGGGINSGAIDDGAQSLTVTNTTVTRTTQHRSINAGPGISMYVHSSDSSSLTVTNCTVIDAFIGVRAWVETAGSIGVTLRNDILWDNQGSASFGADLKIIGAGVTVDADHNDIGIRMNDAGTYNDLGGNISVDPQLDAQRIGTQLLVAGSPAIDSGTCTGAPATDFEGDVRPTGGGCDIGADEFVGP